MSDLEFIAFLASVNPKFSEHPASWNRELALLRAKQLFHSLRDGFGDAVLFDENVQDATYHAGIFVPPTEVRLSNFGCLVTIVGEELLKREVNDRVIQIVECCGYTHVPFRLFGEPFVTRERFNGDLFNQLFDYV